MCNFVHSRCYRHNYKKKKLYFSEDNNFFKSDYLCMAFASYDCLFTVSSTSFKPHA